MLQEQMILQQTALARLGIKLQLFLILKCPQKVGNIYISSYLSATQVNLLQKNKIKSILTIAKSCKVSHNKQIVSDYLYVPIQDKKTVDIRKQFTKCFQFIDHCRQRTNILIHCKVGVSRSAAIVTAYLMYKLSLDLHEAYQIIKQGNAKAKPNIGFIAQLIKYNRELGRAQVGYDEKNNKFYYIANQQQKQKKQKSLQRLKLREQVLGLQKQKEKIDQHIADIKRMIQQNSSRSQKMSKYLKNKINYSKSKSNYRQV